MTVSDGANDVRTQTLRDSVTVFWLLLWLTVGVLVGVQVWTLSTISDAAEASATAADEAGQALQELSRVPVIGESTGELGTSVRVAAEEVSRSAGQTREDLHQLSILLAVSVALVPATPLLALYLPRRMEQRRRVRELRAELDSHGRSRQLDAYLAQRAVSELRYRELRAVTSDPVGDLLAGRHADLADAQLDRLGLSLRPSSTTRG